MREGKQDMRGITHQMLRLSVTALLVISCGGGGRAALKAPAPTSDAPGAAVMPASGRDQIEELDAQITAAVTELKLDDARPEAIQSGQATPMGAVTAAGDPACRPAKTETCSTSCTLSDSVCSNADKICTLAADMQGDTWAENKCKRANLMCQASHKKCCGCQ